MTVSMLGRSPQGAATGLGGDEVGGDDHHGRINRMTNNGLSGDAHFSRV